MKNMIGQDKVRVSLLCLATLAASFWLATVHAQSESGETTATPMRLLRAEAEKTIRSLEVETAALKKQLNEFQATIPIGMVVAFAGSRAPTGWRFCDGASVGREEFPELFAAIGTTYGTSNSTSFSLPDYRGTFLRGLDNGKGIDKQKNRLLGSVQGFSTALPSKGREFITSKDGDHNHNVNDTGQGDQDYAEGDRDKRGVGGVYDRILRVQENGLSSTNGAMDYRQAPSRLEPDIQHAVPMATTGNHVHKIEKGGDDESRPVNVAVNFIIRVHY